MSGLDDAAVARLRAAADVPDLGDRYEVRAPIGHGGSSVVYAALRPGAGPRGGGQDADAYGADRLARARLTREARILATLEHPGIVPVHDTGVTPDGRAFYVMTLVRGAGLAETAANVTLPGRMRLFLDVCDTVAFAHAHGVVHRDLEAAERHGRAASARCWSSTGAWRSGHRRVGRDRSRRGRRHTRASCRPNRRPVPHWSIGVPTSSPSAAARMGCSGRRRRGRWPPSCVAPRRPARRSLRRRQPLQADVRRYLDGLAVSAYAEPLGERLVRVVIATGCRLAWSPPTWSCDWR